MLVVAVVLLDEKEEREVDTLFGDLGSRFKTLAWLSSGLPIPRLLCRGLLHHSSLCAAVPE